MNILHNHAQFSVELSHAAQFKRSEILKTIPL